MSKFEYIILTVLIVILLILAYFTTLTFAAYINVKSDVNSIYPYKLLESNK